jgi:hypothetical protein
MKIKCAYCRRKAVQNVFVKGEYIYYCKKHKVKEVK